MKLVEVARLVDGEIIGEHNVEIERLSKIEEAGTGDITFYANSKYAKHLSITAASAILISNNLDLEQLQSRRSSISIVKVEDAYSAFLKLLDVFYPCENELTVGIHPSAVVMNNVIIGERVAIGANVFINDKCKIGNNVQIYPNVVLGGNIDIGDNTLIYPNVTLREGSRVGKRVIIHSGTVIGSDGFGFAPKPDGTYEKIPQRGIVVIEDDVEIGANCTIDRATLGETRIKSGVKLDNLIHIAHNVVVGENTVIAAQTGISGSTKLGKNCIVAGQVGIVGHIQIADRTTFAAKSGIPKSITEPGQTFFGYPAKEHSRALRIEGAIRQLPELVVEIRELKKKIEDLESRLKNG